MGQAGQPKQYIPLLDRPIIAWTLRACAAAASVAEIVLVVSPEDVAYCRRQVAGPWAVGKPVHVVPGGDSRQASVRAGLAASAADISVVAVHDGVRPILEAALLDEVIGAAARHGAATVAVPVKDTIKHVADGWVQSTPPRRTLRAVQTPQAFRRDLLARAHEKARAAGREGTDDASLVEAMGKSVAVVKGTYANIKITTPEDLLLAETLLRSITAGDTPQNEDDPTRSRKEDTMRIGIGYDVHAFASHRPLILGGVRVPASEGLAGHSDADVLLHAIMDALLGAAALGDIGTHFPDTDPRYEGADSGMLLERVVGLLSEAGWRANNVDATVVAEKPRLAPYVDAMAKRIAETLSLPRDAVNVKATTSEGLGFVGTGQGMAAHAAVSIVATETNSP